MQRPTTKGQLRSAWAWQFNSASARTYAHLSWHELRGRSLLEPLQARSEKATSLLQLIFGFVLQIQPITLNRSTIDGSPLDPPEQPHIQPSYYAGLLINTFIGSSGNAKISELTVWDDNVSGYAAYENGKLVRAVFINLDAWLQSSVGSRPSVHIDPILYWSEDSSVANDAAAWKNRKAQGRRIIINHADDIQNLTWGGQSWETSDIRPKGRPVVEKVDLGSGFDLRSTEAILLSFTS